MFGSFDNLILHILAKLNKIGAVTGHAYREITMFDWVILRVNQRLLINHVKLNMLAALAEVRSDQRRRLLQIAVRF